MPTIVEYTTEKRPLNAYPMRIISPPAPLSCCRAHMVQISGIHADGEGRFFYKRCLTCGFTLRHFLPVPMGIYLEGIFHIEGEDDLKAAG